MKNYNAMEKMIRKTELNLIVGINGSGKTTFIENDIIKVRKKNLIVTPDPMEWKQYPTISTANDIYTLNGTARIIYEDLSTLEMIKEK